jgi:DNA polymerase-3 subunit delta'
MRDSLSKRAPWIARQTGLLLTQSGHAWLLQGPSGLGQYALALELARAWLCEQPSDSGACDSCPSCHAIDVRTHADLCVLMPETTMLELGWPLSEKAQADLDEKKRKASKEIRVDAMRDALEFAQRTSSRGRGKVVLMFPAEAMNHVTANALLKTLEEPAGDLRFVLATESAHQLLPTIRSRCISHVMHWPEAGEARLWLEQQGLSHDALDPALRAAGGRPELALGMAGATLKAWPLVPKAFARGDVAAFKDWSPMQLLDAAHKLCHDLMVLDAGATPRFFPQSSLQGLNASRVDLAAWAKELASAMRTVEHPFNAGLMAEAFVSRAQTVLNSSRTEKY